jgi:hypothetical protein
LAILRGDVIEPELPELMLPKFRGGEFQPMPDSRRMDDLIRSGELDKSRSRNGDLWFAIVAKFAENEHNLSNNERGVSSGELVMLNDELVVLNDVV